jgi:dipeptide/tripeptide permease
MIAKVTDDRTSSMGFGIFYWAINLGAFIFPMFIVPALKSINGSYVIIASAVCTGLMIIPTILFYKDPPKKVEEKKEPFGLVMTAIWGKIKTVFKDWRFILFIFIYSWFWVLYFQMFDSVLWYVKYFVDPTALNNFVKSVTGINWHFDVEHVTVINALTIILLQLFISALVKNWKAMPTIIIGISCGTIGMAILALSSSIWVFMLGIFIFSLGEMTAHPKFYSYLGNLAPADKKGTYMGFGFLYGVFGSFIGSNLGAWLYVRFVDNPMIAFVQTKLQAAGSSVMLAPGSKIEDALKAAGTINLTKAEISKYALTSELWLLFASIGVACIIGLLLYQKFVAYKTSDTN